MIRFRCIGHLRYILNLEIKVINLEENKVPCIIDTIAITISHLLHVCDVIYYTKPIWKRVDDIHKAEFKP